MHLAKQRTVVVLPTPGGPAIIMLGAFPSREKTAKRETVSLLPTISSNVLGLYFSIQGRCRPLPLLLPLPLPPALEVEAVASADEVEGTAEAIILNALDVPIIQE